MPSRDSLSSNLGREEFVTEKEFEFDSGLDVFEFRSVVVGVVLRLDVFEFK